MPKLRIPPSSIKHLQVFCNACKRRFKDVCPSTGKKTCTHHERHVYKAEFTIPGTKKIRTRSFETDDLDEAVRATFDFKQELEESNFQTKVEEEINDPTRPSLLLHCFANYVAYLNNYNIPLHMQKQRTSQHVNEVQRHLNYVVAALSKKGYDLDIMKIEQLGNREVGMVYDYIINEKKFANSTYNRFFTNINCFYLYLGDYLEYNLRNPFRKVVRRKTSKNPVGISIEEFNKLLSIVTPENGYSERCSGKKDYMYKSYIKDAFRLFLLTGRRRDEVLLLKFSDIKTDKNGGMKYIEVEDRKVNMAQNNYVDQDELKKVYVPIIKQLRELLISMDYEKYKGTDEYILAPESEFSRAYLKDFVSRSFTHYWKQLNTGKDVSLRHLRKSYITYLQIALNGQARGITGHSAQSVLDKHYIDRELIARTITDFEMPDL